MVSAIPSAGIGRVGVGHHIDESFVRRAAPIVEHVEQFGYDFGPDFLALLTGVRLF